MKSCFQPAARCVVPLLMVVLSLLAGCNRMRNRNLEVAYVSAPQVVLRDRVAAVYNKMGFVKNGERVEILERERRFAHVRTSAGVEGWMEQRYLVTQQVYDGFQALAREEQNAPVQGTAITRNETNLHVEPGRDTEHLYMLAQGAKVALLTRGTSEKGPSSNAPRSPKPGAEELKPVLEDWWLIRDPDARVGWVLGRMLDTDVPMEVAQYAEGQRIVAFFVLDEVQDGDKKIPQYLMLLTEPKDGMPFDYNQARVFTWNLKRHRYETAYRERLRGVLPVVVSHEVFDKEGDLPTFTLRVQDDQGNVTERRYKLNTPIVRRVLAPGETSHQSPVVGHQHRHPARKRN
jgi:SH3-like domain-containing protein